MPQILVENLEKRFQVAERTAGFWGALKGLAARRYRDVDALHDVTFSVEPGELVGYIGPNRAGKSTTIKILAGILVPSSGRCEINGPVPWRDRVRHVARIGVVFGQRTQLWCDLPVLDEPTIGLDAISKLAMRSFIKRQNRERGTTVLLTTHDRTISRRCAAGLFRRLFRSGPPSRSS